VKTAGRPALALVVLAWGSASAQAAPALRVGSKSFTESVILGEMAALLAAGAGAPVDHRRALGGTRLCWDALLAGELDVYPEYTGTLAQEILAGAGAGPDLGSLRAALRARGIGLIGPLGFDNTYALGMREPVAARLEIRTLSDLRRHPELRFGFSNEFMSRRDGWPGLAARYQLAQTRVQGLDHDLAYRGLADDRIDATDLYATDAEIRRYRLRVLGDDLGFFPKYEAVLLYRLDARTRWPAALAALERLSGRIDAGAMSAMNARVKLDRVTEGAVAAAFVSDRLGLQPALPDAGGGGRARSILRRTREHLTLVGISLTAALLLALPLGILAARRPRVGQVILGAVGVVQTIPSLALLVFMIPLLGIGAVPATAALLLYSLLPIVRNTHAALASIPAPVREAAEALGLPPRAILWRIELPLGLATILAGVKSAAVINVGTATLGALVGAGGFGQPIFTGIRLDDVPLILEGAVPASLLALMVQGMFDLLERVLVPRGLRLDGRS
jgi:osmoprotectant transport system permease protein